MTALEVKIECDNNSRDSERCRGYLLPIERVESQQIIGSSGPFREPLGINKLWKCSKCGREVK